MIPLRRLSASLAVDIEPTPMGDGYIVRAPWLSEPLTRPTWADCYWDAMVLWKQGQDRLNVK